MGQQVQSGDPIAGPKKAHQLRQGFHHWPAKAILRSAEETGHVPDVVSAHLGKIQGQGFTEAFKRCVYMLHTRHTYVIHTKNIVVRSRAAEHVKLSNHQTGRGLSVSCARVPPRNPMGQIWQTCHSKTSFVWVPQYLNS